MRKRLLTIAVWLNIRPNALVPHALLGTAQSMTLCRGSGHCFFLFDGLGLLAVLLVRHAVTVLATGFRGRGKLVSV